ncbi:hypothetical protein KS4_27250 [Poriferisphaera corsica]|uniref:TonB C-terminal domain-containing protein n=1 Tax=Poriferisphaera corsica TaxID=2528020 RepID=A0A517YWP7_9BACT|nr:hypothetical protein [Poriferisphaera corsica]QDU34654.1 hypothetical protein KS4_27250 [Poriferisphaera corsica]
MQERDPNFPLALGLIWALLIHALLWPVIIQGLRAASLKPLDELAEVVPLEDQEKEKPDNEVYVGEEGLDITSVAWIPYEDFKELIAPKTITEQPAVQTKVTPVPGAPMIIDATEPAPNSQSETIQPIEMVEQDQQDQEEATAAKQPYNIPISDTPEVQIAMVTPSDQAAEGDAEKDSPDTTNAVQTQVGAPNSKARPTSSPKGEMESPPTALVARNLRIQPGAVFAYGDVKVITKLPRFSVAAILTTLRSARNPVAIIEFNPKGEVVRVKVTSKAGFANVDGPVLSSLYSWKASGPGLKKYNTVVMEVTILLRG